MNGIKLMVVFFSSTFAEGLNTTIPPLPTAPWPSATTSTTVRSLLIKIQPGKTSLSDGFSFLQLHENGNQYNRLSKVNKPLPASTLDK